MELVNLKAIREAASFAVVPARGQGEGMELVCLEKFLIGGQVLEIEVRI